jgi:hypothetical protein
VIGRKFDMHCLDVDRFENSGRRGAEGQAIAFVEKHPIAAGGRMWCAASLGEGRNWVKQEVVLCRHRRCSRRTKQHSDMQASLMQ